MLSLRGVQLVNVNTFVGPVPGSWLRTRRSCPDLSRGLPIRREALQGRTTVRISGIKCRLQDAEVLHLLEQMGFPCGLLDFVFVPRRTSRLCRSTHYGYVFANCVSGFVAAALVDACEQAGYACTLADVQGADVNLHKFRSASSAATAWVADAAKWHKVERPRRP